MKTARQVLEQFGEWPEVRNFYPDGSSKIGSELEPALAALCADVLRIVGEGQLPPRPRPPGIDEKWAAQDQVSAGLREKLNQYFEVEG